MFVALPGTVLVGTLHGSAVLVEPSCPACGAAIGHHSIYDGPARPDDVLVFCACGYYLGVLGEYVTNVGSGSASALVTASQATETHGIGSCTEGLNLLGNLNGGGAEGSPGLTEQRRARCVIASVQGRLQPKQTDTTVVLPVTTLTVRLGKTYNPEPPSTR